MTVATIIPKKFWEGRQVALGSSAGREEQKWHSQDNGTI